MKRYRLQSLLIITFLPIALSTTIVIQGMELTSPTTPVRYFDFYRPQEIKVAIESGTNINAPFTDQEIELHKSKATYLIIEQGDTPLITSLRNNLLEAALLLLDYGANPNIPDGKGTLPLSHACALKLDTSPKIIIKLLSEGANPENVYVTAQNRESLTQWPYLLHAAISDDSNALQWALTSHPNTDQVLEALGFAIGQAHIKIAETLLNHLISNKLLSTSNYIRFMDKVSRILAQTTSSEKKKSEYKLLYAIIKEKFSTNILNKLPIPTQTKEILLKLTQANHTSLTAWEKLIKAIITDNLSDTKKALQEERADPNQADDGGSTPLHYAALGCTNKMIFCLLLEHKARIVLDNKSNSPRKLATLVQQPNSITSLLSPDAFLFIAAKSGNAELLQHAIKSGANIDIQNTEERTPLSYACQKGYLGIIETLMNHKANPDTIDKAGRTPFDYLPFPTQKTREEIKQFLINKRNPTLQQHSMASSLPYFQNSSSSSIPNNNIYIITLPPTNLPRMHPILPATHQPTTQSSSTTTATKAATIQPLLPKTSSENNTQEILAQRKEKINNAITSAEKQLRTILNQEKRPSSSNSSTATRNTSALAQVLSSQTVQSTTNNNIGTTSQISSSTNTSLFKEPAKRKLSTAKLNRTKQPQKKQNTQEIIREQPVFAPTELRLASPTIFSEDGRLTSQTSSVHSLLSSTISRS